jgi:hypothetical protein
VFTLAPRRDVDYFKKKMIADVLQRLRAIPFEPFFIVTSSGRSYRVATADHAGVNPRGSRAVVWFDDDSSVTIAGFHIAAVEKEAAKKRRPA